MVETTSSLLQIVDMVTGGRNNTWGDILDANMTKLENAIAATSAIASTGGTSTLSDDQARPAVLSMTGALLSNHVVVVPNHSKVWLVKNGHTLGAFALTVKTSGGAAVTLETGLTIVYCDGADVVTALSITNLANSRLANMAANTAKANVTGAAAAPQDVTKADLQTWLGALILAATGEQSMAGALALPANGLNVGAGQLRVTGGNVTASGNVTATGEVTAYSDARLKENVETITDALGLVNAMRGVRFTHISSGRAAVGVIAQEMRHVLPAVVHEDPETGLLSVAYQNVVGVLVEAFKEQGRIIDALADRLDALEARA